MSQTATAQAEWLVPFLILHYLWLDVCSFHCKWDKTSEWSSATSLFLLILNNEKKPGHVSLPNITKTCSWMYMYIGQPRGRISRQVGTRFCQDRLLLCSVTAWSEFSEEQPGNVTWRSSVWHICSQAGGQVLHGQAVMHGSCFETLPASLGSQKP